MQPNAEMHEYFEFVIFLVSVEAPNVITFNVISCLDPLVQYCNSSLYKNMVIVIIQLMLSFPVSPVIILQR
jgi:hypothetical protein